MQRLHFTLRHAVSHVSTVVQKLGPGHGLPTLFRQSAPVIFATLILGAVIFFGARHALALDELGLPAGEVSVSADGLAVLVACMSTLTAPHAAVVS